MASRKRQLSDTVYAEADSTTDHIPKRQNKKMDREMDTDSLQIKGGTGAPNGVGMRGPMEGNTKLNEKYSEYYEENTTLHSRKVKNLDLWYGIAANQNSGNPLNSNLSGTLAQWAPVSGNTANNGVYMFPLSAGLPQGGQVGGGMLSQYPLSPNNSYESLMQRVNSLSDAVVAAPINFSVDDLLDNKLLTNEGTGGIMTNYTKFRLLDFSIEMTVRTYDSSTMALNRAKYVANTAGYQAVNETNPAVPNNSTETMDRNNCERPVNIDYWVYRDFYNDYATTGDPTIPLDWVSPGGGNPPNTLDRRARAIRNFDIYLSCLKNEEVFKFERKINERASYYFSLAQLQALRTRPLQYIVNLMEGIVPSSQDLTALQEGFNLMIVPTQCPLAFSATKWGRIAQTDPPNWYLTVPGITTKVYLKFHATWKAFDFNYVAGNPQRSLTDPEFTEAIRHYNEWIEHIQKHRRTRCIDYALYYNIKKVKKIN